MDISAILLTQLLTDEARRRLLDEGIPRLRSCLDRLTEADIWYRPNEHSNSVGNLILHLTGNVRQWLGSGLAGQPDQRQRDAEFAQRDSLPVAMLHQQLDDMGALIDVVLRDLQPNQLTRTYRVQGFEETGVAILLHVVEHFSYHVGQVTYYTKARLDIDTGYYAGQQLNAT